MCAFNGHLTGSLQGKIVYKAMCKVGGVYDMQMRFLCALIILPSHTGEFGSLRWSQKSKLKLKFKYNAD